MCYQIASFTAKSLPLHCVVESVSSLQNVLGSSSTTSTDNTSPEQQQQQQRGQWKRRSNVETDSYVIVPAVTQFCNIVPTALQRLGYSAELGSYAKGKWNQREREGDKMLMLFLLCFFH